MSGSDNLLIDKMESKPDEVVIAIDRYKLRQNAFTVIGKKNIVVNIESHYSRRQGPTSVLKTAEQRAVPGTTFFVPWAETITGLIVNVHSIQDKLTCFIGQTEITTEYFGIKPTSVDLYIKNSGQIVGSMSVSINVRQIFVDEASKPDFSKGEQLCITAAAVEEGVGPYCAPTPEGFRFNRLSRPINWERLRSINLRRHMIRNLINVHATENRI